jgi:hypothetical protein
MSEKYGAFLWTGAIDCLRGAPLPFVWLKEQQRISSVSEQQFIKKQLCSVKFAVSYLAIQSLQ